MARCLLHGRRSPNTFIGHNAYVRVEAGQGFHSAPNRVNALSSRGAALRLLPRSDWSVPHAPSRGRGSSDVSMPARSESYDSGVRIKSSVSLARFHSLIVGTRSPASLPGGLESPASLIASRPHRGVARRRRFSQGWFIGIPRLLAGPPWVALLGGVFLPFCPYYI